MGIGIPHLTVTVYSAWFILLYPSVPFVKVVPVRRYRRLVSQFQLLYEATTVLQ